MAATFLSTVNRILRTCAIIRGDTDTISTFSDTQHNASLNLAVVAVQQELVRLVADRLIPAERKTSGTITLAADTRTYSLASDFVRFYGVPHFYNSSGNRQIYEFPGGLEALQVQYYTYATDTGSPNYWYWEPTTTKKVGLFQVPSSGEAGEVWTYEYEGSVLISDVSDTLPFPNTEEDYMFTDMAARRFKFMWEDVKNELDIQAVLEKDATYRSSKATLMALIRGYKPKRSYSNHYA
jgi:hypothetical protein